MQGSILSRFQSDMGLDDNPDASSSGQSWGSLDEGVTGDTSPELERASSTDGEDRFPFTPAQRRPRSLSDEGQVPERELKRRKEFAKKTCTEQGLPPDALAEFSQMHQADMIIELRAFVMSLKQKSEKDEAQKYIASEEFKDILKERLQCCLLSPNLTGYVIGTASNILEYAKKNTATFKIPEKAVQDPKLLDTIATMVKDLLTSQRSNIKQKLANSIRSQGHVSLLARTLAPGSHFEITMSHWARYGFLRSSMITFNQLVDEGRLATITRNQSLRTGDTNTNSNNGTNRSRTEDAGAADRTATADEVSTQAGTNGEEKIWLSNEFWEFVDTLLSQTRADAMEQDSTIQGQQKKLETTFTKCLQADMKVFPPSPSQSSTPPSDKVTVPWLRDINNHLLWTNP